MTHPSKQHDIRWPSNFFRWARRYPLKAWAILVSASVTFGAILVAFYFLLRVQRLPPVDLASLGGLLGIAGGLGLFILVIVGSLLTVAGFAAGSVLRTEDVNNAPKTEHDKAEAKKRVDAGQRQLAFGVVIIMGAAGLWIYLRVNALEALPEARGFDWRDKVAIVIWLVAIWPMYLGCKRLNKSDSFWSAFIATLLLGWVQFVPLLIMLTFAQRSDAAAASPFLTLVPATIFLLAINVVALFLTVTTPIRSFVGGFFLLVVLAAIAVPLYFQDPMLYSNLVVKHLNLGNTLAHEINLSPEQCRRLLGAQAGICPKDKEAVFSVSKAQVVSNVGDEFVFRAWTCGWEKERGPFAGLLQYPLRISTDGRPGVVEEPNGPLRTDKDFEAVMQCAELETGVCGIGSRGRIEKFYFNGEHFQPKQSTLADSGQDLSNKIGAAYKAHAADAHIIVFARHAAELESDDPAAPDARADYVFNQLRRVLAVPSGRIKRENSSCRVGYIAECASLPKKNQVTCRSEGNHRLVDVWVISPPEEPFQP